ncbi:MarR family winged helix-turn-helix transcriptional regulator [Plantactinospora sonchi]|uniref:MarR family winged helix-turn-helix transcriptional regulator n=1 Tax=Plantactinospora sonchi TaxID=1544735 RepID=A0ABU7RN51_9ACTN
MKTPAHHGELVHRMRNLSRVVRLIRQRRVTERPGVPLGMVGTLMRLDEMADRAVGCHAKELAEQAGLDPSTVSRAVAALVAQGLVVRRADPADRRASFLALTAAGRAALHEAQAWYGDLLADALAEWSPAQVEAFGAALDRFAADIQGALDRATDATEATRTGDPPVRTDVPEPNNSQNKLEAAR